MKKCLDIKPCEALRHFVKGKPPMVLFIIVLFVFAFAFIGLVLYVDWLDLSQPESQKWEVFVDRLNDVKFCVEDHELRDPSDYVPGNSEQNFSVALNVAVEPTHMFAKSRYSRIQATLNASDLGFPDMAPDVAVLLTLGPLIPDCTDKKKSGCKQETVVAVCATFYNLTSYFPDHSKVPKTCSQGIDSAISVPSPSSPSGRIVMVAQSECLEATRIQFTSKKATGDDSLIGQQDQNRKFIGRDIEEISSLHLLYTSYFVFFMAITVLVYSAYKTSRTFSSSVSSPEKLSSVSG